ncbi:hypothetical protein [Paenirhodobacter populi]|uniref:hypothetical protein n=1 Tax=Paenirhodobacter populi TaxID=2306993 RepID=UPI001F4F6F58|nr:hypothetical protein [Sinirhodobacter populi]
MTFPEVDRFRRDHDPNPVRREDHVPAVSARATDAYPICRGPGFQADGHGTDDELGPLRHRPHDDRARLLAWAQHQRRKLYGIFRRGQNQPPFPRQRSPR